MKFEWEPGGHLLIESSEYRLRSLTEDDVSDEYISWLNDPEVLQYINSRNRTKNRKTICNYVARHDNLTSFHLGIFPTETGAHIGNFTVVCDVKNKTAHTHVLIGNKDWWGTGAVLAARELLLQFLFNEMGVYKVIGTPLARNIPAVFNYKKQGFKVEGILKEHIVLTSGSRSDIVHFAMFRSDFVSYIDDNADPKI